MSQVGGRRKAAGRSGRWSWRYTIAVTFLTLVVLVMGGVAAVAYANLRWLEKSEAAGREALAAARSMARDLLSYDYRTVERDLARARAHTTGELTSHYGTLATTLARDARKERAVQRATVVAAGVEAAEPDRVEVVLFVNMSITKQPEGESEPRVQHSPNRARFVMVRRDGRWLVAELSTLLGSVPAE